MACQNCTLSGRVCNGVTLSCTSGTGGGAGGGFAGGSGGGVAGGSGGGSGSGNYVAASITAACDDMTGAMPLLSTSTTPAIGDDRSTAPFLLPISFPFFGVTAPYASVQTNGMVQFHSSSMGVTSTVYTGTAIPSVSDPNGFAAAFWIDLYNPPSSTGLVRMKTASVGGARVTVSWLSPQSPMGSEIQAKFFTTGVIEYHYCTIVAAGASIGVEDATGTRGTNYTSSVASGGGVRLTFFP
jgi:hypothetical protein